MALVQERLGFRSYAQEPGSTGCGRYYISFFHLIILYNIVLTSESVNDTLVCDHSIEKYFHSLLVIFLYKIVLILVCINGTLECDHSNESF